MEKEKERKQIVDDLQSTSWSDIKSDDRLALDYICCSIVSLDLYKKSKDIKIIAIDDDNISSFIGKEMNLLMNFFWEFNNKGYTLIDYLYLICRSFVFPYDAPNSEYYFADTLVSVYKVSKLIKKNITRNDLSELPIVLFKSSKHKKIVEDTILFLIKQFKAEVTKLNRLIHGEIKNKNEIFYRFIRDVDFSNNSNKEACYLTAARFYFHNLMSILYKIEESLKIIDSNSQKS